jgi:hypothetical protein
LQHMSGSNIANNIIQANPIGFLKALFDSKAYYVKSGEAEALGHMWLTHSTFDKLKEFPSLTEVLSGMPEKFKSDTTIKMLDFLNEKGIVDSDLSNRFIKHEKNRIEIEKLRARKKKPEKPQPQELEKYDIPDDYAMASPMHQTFENKNRFKAIFENSYGL